MVKAALHGVVGLILTLCLCGPLHAGEPLKRDVVLKAGQSWFMIVERQDDDGGPLDTSHQIYMAVFMSAPPAAPEVYARFRVESSPVVPGKMVVQADKRQTRALAGKKGVWVFSYLPELGDRTYNIIRGTMEVKP
jgi:hypothetical protein